MGTYQVEYLAAALRDIEEAVSYVAHELHDATAAERLGARIVETAESLPEFPHRRPVYRALATTEHEVRWILAGRHYLFYWVDEDARMVTIARVVYARRDLGSVRTEDIYPHLG